MLNYDKVRSWESAAIEQTMKPKDVMLYALGLGLGRDPLDRNQLSFTSEKGLRVLPTMAAVLAYPGFWMRDTPGVGIDVVKVVHGEQSLWLHQPIPAEGKLVGRSRVTRVVDKGPGKGALVHVEKIISGADGARLATAEGVVFCRGDGGFSAHGGGDEPAELLQATPDTSPETVLEFETRTEAALIYRLSGDYNPLHSDPDVAARAGFSRPILHGLNTYGVAGHLLLQAFCGWDPARLRSLRARFSAPAYPGDLIRLECWKVHGGESGEIAFRALVPVRDAVVLSHGRAVCR
jgi:acyl dehydratase